MVPFWEAPSGGKSSRALGDRIEPFSEGGSSGSGLIRDPMHVDPPAQQGSDWGLAAAKPNIVQQNSGRGIAAAKPYTAQQDSGR